MHEYQDQTCDVPSSFYNIVDIIIVARLSRKKHHRIKSASLNPWWLQTNAPLRYFWEEVIFVVILAISQTRYHFLLTS